MWGDDWDDVRRLWLLDPEVAHCNHGSFGAVPGPVLAAQDEFRVRMATNPMRWFDRELPAGPAIVEIAFDGILNDQLHGFYRSTYTDSSGLDHVLATTQFGGPARLWNLSTGAEQR